MVHQCPECGVYALEPWDFPWFICDNCGETSHMCDVFELDEDGEIIDDEDDYYDEI